MQKFHLRYYNTNALIGFVIFLGFSIGWFMDWLQLSGQVIGVSIIGMLILILSIIDTYLWKYPLFKMLFWIKDFSGRYEGEIRFINPIDKGKDKKKCVIEIYQTSSIIKLTSFFQRNSGKGFTQSESTTENIIRKDNGSYTIVYTYENKGIVSNPRFPIHYGTNLLKVIINQDGTYLKGQYYTNKEPQTKGFVDVKLISKQLKHYI